MKQLVVIACIALAAAWSRPAAAESQQFRIATLAPAGSPWMVILDRAAAEITDKTERRITKRSQKKARASIRKANAEAHELLLRKGIQVVDVSQAMVDELTAIAADIRRELTGKLFTKEELAMLLAHRDAYRAKHEAPAATKTPAR